MYRILAINPGSTSTKISVYDDETELFEKTIVHTEKELSNFKEMMDQLEWRKSLIENTLKEKGIDIKTCSAIASRGGIMKPIKGGTYILSDAILNDIKAIDVNGHASNLAAFIAKSISDKLNIPAYVVDPVVVDEMSDIARITGFPEIQRISRFHALNQKAVGLLAAKELGKRYEEINLIVAHLGGGVSVGAHLKGQIVDVNDSVQGDGPFSSNRSGGLPVGPLIRLCFSGKYTEKELIERVTSQSGIIAHIGTNQMEIVEKNALAGNEKSKLILDAMCYQVAKSIGAAAAVLEGKVDAVILTGGIIKGKYTAEEIARRVSFIAKVIFYPGEEEMKALTNGVLRVLRGEEKAKIYQ